MQIHPIKLRITLILFKKWSHKETFSDFLKFMKSKIINILIEHK